MVGIYSFQMTPNVANNCNITDLSNQLQMFNFHNEVDFVKGYEKHYLEDLKVNAYFFQMKNSEDFLIAIEENNLLRPVIFANISKKQFSYKDINNWKTTILVNTETTETNSLINNVIYFEMNDSKEGLAIAEGGCLGGSTSACIQIGVSACMQDPVCAITCAFVLKECVGAIALACLINCNTTD